VRVIAEDRRQTFRIEIRNDGTHQAQVDLQLTGENMEVLIDGSPPGASLTKLSITAAPGELVVTPACMRRADLHRKSGLSCSLSFSTASTAARSKSV
jgi:hypothetical protein